jgi:antitoxin CptB
MPDVTELSRLKWRCRRGMLELDTLLLGYLDKCYLDMDENEKQDFIELLEFPDPELYQYLMGYSVPKEGRLNYVITRIRESA